MLRLFLLTPTLTGYHGDKANFRLMLKDIPLDGFGKHPFIINCWHKLTVIRWLWIRFYHLLNHQREAYLNLDNPYFNVNAPLGN